MDRATAISEIRRIFGKYRSAQSGHKKLLQALTDGKLYELHVLADILDALSARGFALSLFSVAGGPPLVNVPVNPASEFVLAFIDGAGLNYAQSPTAYGIELRHIEP